MVERNLNRDGLVAAVQAAARGRGPVTATEAAIRAYLDAAERMGEWPVVTVEESCPCGATLSVSAFDASFVDRKLEEFRRAHDVCRVAPRRPRVVKGAWDA